MLVRARVAIVSLFVAIALSIGAGAGVATDAGRSVEAVSPASAGDMPIRGISPALCFLLVASRDQLLGPSCTAFDLAPQALHDVADFIGDDDSVVEPDDFSEIDLEGNQIHQMDDYVAPWSGNGSLWIMVWVPNQGPVTFTTTRGVFVPPFSLGAPGGPHPTTDDVGSTWVCDNERGATHIALLEDADCGPGFGPGDGVVVARLRARYGESIADIRPGVVTVTQGASDTATMPFQVVGEPAMLKITRYERTIQTGITDPFLECGLPWPSDASGLRAVRQERSKTIIVARAYDAYGNSVTGALVSWRVDDPLRAAVAAMFTPTLDLGRFGYGAPNVVCGTANAGVATVTARGGPDFVIGVFPLVLDPEAAETLATASYKIIAPGTR